MGLAALAVIAIVVGFVVRTLPDREGAVPTGIAGLGLVAAGIILFAFKTFVVIDVGQVGVQRWLGEVRETSLESGVRVVNPLATIERMSVRQQTYPAQGSDRVEAQTAEQLNVTLDISILYQINGLDAPRLYRQFGSEAQIKESIVQNAARNGVRDAIATRDLDEIFSPDRARLASIIQEAVQAKADEIQVQRVFVRDIQAPDRVRESIEQKQQREQQVAAEEFQTQIVQERARQQIEEAKGIAEAQRIISQGLTPEYLTFFYIQQLTQMPEGSVIYVPTEGGIPLIRNLNGSE